MGYVYIYRSGGDDVFKIGRSTDYNRRVKAHATGNPEPLTEFDVIETEHAAQCETYLHHRLRSKQSRRGGQGKEWFEVDPDELAAVIADARHYVEETLPMITEAELLAGQQCEDRIIEPSDSDWAAYLELVNTRERYETLEFDLHRLEAQVKLAIGTASGMERVAMWKTVPRHSFDSVGFKAKHPEIYEIFARESHSRTFTLL